MASQSIKTAGKRFGPSDQRWRRAAHFVDKNHLIL